jgi:hypothetical protein
MNWLNFPLGTWKQFKDLKGANVDGKLIKAGREFRCLLETVVVNEFLRCWSFSNKKLNRKLEKFIKKNFLLVAKF